MEKLKELDETERGWLARAERYCSQGEQCRQTVTEKLLSWGAGMESAMRIADKLVEEGFVDDARYCRIYCESKLHLQKWGRVKIAYNLRAKRIDSAIIANALDNLDEERYTDTLTQLAESKSRTLKESDPMKRRAKIAAFLASHGFERNEIYEAINKLKTNIS